MIIYPDSVIKEIRSGSLEKILEVADIKTCIPDPEANIFKHSDFGMVMDSHEFIEKLYDYVKG